MRLRHHRSLLALERGFNRAARCDQRHAAGQAQAQGGSADDRPLHQGVAGDDRVHDADPGRMARRKVKTDAALVDYADKEPSAFASMLGGLIEANVKSRPEKESDFASLVAKVGIWVTDIDEGVTLDFKGGRLIVQNGLKPRRSLTIRADAETAMSLSNLTIGLLGLRIYYDGVGRGVAAKLRRGKLKIDGLLPNLITLNAVTRIFSVQ